MMITLHRNSNLTAAPGPDTPKQILNEALAYPRVVFKPVTALSAFAFIMVHNHPSGDPFPSEADLRLTAGSSRPVKSCNSS
ncbi:MAG: hypothetical protein JO333_14480 [Verrucomicrobia bacterium]|nr:hypothetical protein [Verrucomicrobiota bacterium]